MKLIHLFYQLRHRWLIIRLQVIVVLGQSFDCQLQIEYLETMIEIYIPTNLVKEKKLNKFRLEQTNFEFLPAD